MTNTHLQSLDRASAERIMKYEYSEEPAISHTIRRGKLKAGKEFATYSWPINREGNAAERFLCHSMKAKDWTPSSPNSGQIFLVLDVMTNIGYEIDLVFNGEKFFINIYKDDINVASSSCTDKSKRNPTILECCLEALERKSDGS